MTISSFFCLFSCSEPQSGRQCRGVFLLLFLNCGVRVLLAISVCRSRWQTGPDTYQAANTPAAAPAAGGATRREAWTEPAWVALASAADESVLAVKTLSPEGHLSSNAASQRTPVLDLFPKLCQMKRFACVKHTKPRSLYPATDSLSFRVNLWWQNSLWFKATSFLKSFHPYTLSMIPVEIFLPARLLFLTH